MPFNHGSVQKDLFCLHNTQYVFCSLHCFSASFLLIYFHFLGYITIRNLLNNKSWRHLSKLVIKLVGYFNATCANLKIFLLKHPLKILQLIFDRIASFSHLACLCHRALHCLSSKDIGHLHHNLWYPLSIYPFLHAHESYACDVFFMIPCEKLRWPAYHACS